MIDKTEKHFDIDLSELKEISGQKDAEIDEEAAKQGDSDTSKEKTKKDTTSHENQS